MPETSATLEIAPDMVAPTVAMVQEVHDKFWSLVLQPEFPVKSAPQSGHGTAIGIKKSALEWRADINGLPLLIQATKNNIEDPPSLSGAYTYTLLTVGESEATTPDLAGNKFSANIGSEGVRIGALPENKFDRLLEICGLPSQEAFMTAIEKYASGHDPDTAIYQAYHSTTIHRKALARHAQIEAKQAIGRTANGQPIVLQQLGINIDHAFSFEAILATVGTSSSVLNNVSLYDTQPSNGPEARDAIPELSIPLLGALSRAGHMVIKQAEMLMASPNTTPPRGSA